jgi:pimeloyl-ACP methyl ester carboxylesterase
MQQARIDDITLEFARSGAGEPVVFVHGAFIAEAFNPLLAEPALTATYQLVVYRRRGYGSLDQGDGPVTIARQAADCRELQRQLGIPRAHVAGHSFGGCVALQLALDSPELVHSLVLLEPGLAVGASAQQYREALARGIARYHEVGAETVVDEFLNARWPGYRPSLDRVLPGAFAQAVAHAGTWLERDLPGLFDWEFGQVQARQISQPVLSVLGGGSDVLWSRFGETHQLLLAWLLHAEGFVLPGATHFLHLENPSFSHDMARALADFFARHPITA